jgi:hypothetical protein
MIKAFDKPIKRSKQVEDFVKNGGVIYKVPSKKTAAKLHRISNGYFKPQAVMGPSKKKGKSS